MSLAILGATGNVGLNIFKLLAQNPEPKEIHVLVRSRSKLERLAGKDVVSRPNVKVFEGSIEDGDILLDCLRGTRAVFLCVAVNANIPGVRIARDTSEAAVAALQSLRKQDSSVKIPHVIVLSSSSTSKKLSESIPEWLHRFLMLGASNIYADLIEAEKFLRSQGDWLDCTFIKPGGLVDDVQRGHVLSLERQQTFLSFIDLAAGMIEVADDGPERWDQKEVAVIPTTNGTKVEWRVPIFLFLGLLLHFFPSTYSIMSRIGIV